MWSEGINKVAGVSVSYQVKHFDEGSEFGIDGGRISKLEMWLNERWNVAGEVILHKNVVARYDRGWNIIPNMEDQAVAVVYHDLLKKYN